MRFLFGQSLQRLIPSRNAAQDMSVRLWQEWRHTSAELSAAQARIVELEQQLAEALDTVEVVTDFYPPEQSSSEPCGYGNDAPAPAYWQNEPRYRSLEEQMQADAAKLRAVFSQLTGQGECLMTPEHKQKNMEIEQLMFGNTGLNPRDFCNDLNLCVNVMQPRLKDLGLHPQYSIVIHNSIQCGGMLIWELANLSAEARVDAALRALENKDGI